MACTWTSTTKEDSPHTNRSGPPPTGILPSILDHIGNTPLVRLNRIPEKLGLECELLCKCEFFNAGGSVKDRIGKRMIEDAEASGRIKPGDVLIEPTSGNTGIGLALSAAVKGYRCIVTMPEKMSQEKVDVLRALGAEIIRTPTEAAFDAPESHISVATRLQQEIPNAHILDQYVNPSNPLAHYDGTAEELLRQTDGHIDMIVLSAGTGGTITGIARKLKERLPNIIVVGVDPKGSILAVPESLNTESVNYTVEGIGYDFIPRVLDRSTSLIDSWIKTEDKDSLHMSRQMIRDEGLLCGGSAGAACWGAIQAIKQYKMGKGKRVVFLAADSVRNYMTKFLNDGWMYDNGLMDAPVATDQWWGTKTVANLKLEAPLTVEPQLSCKDAVQIMHEHGIDQLPVVNSSNDVLGVITEGNLMSQIAKGRVSPDHPLSEATYSKFKPVSNNTTLNELSLIFDMHHFALVVSTQKCFTGDKVVERTIISGVVTRINLLHYITTHESSM